MCAREVRIENAPKSRMSMWVRPVLDQSASHGEVTTRDRWQSTPIYTVRPTKSRTRIADGDEIAAGFSGEMIQRVTPRTRARFTTPYLPRSRLRLHIYRTEIRGRKNVVYGAPRYIRCWVSIDHEGISKIPAGGPHRRTNNGLTR